MIAVVAGGTGLVGGLLIKKLLDDPFYSKVIVVSRVPLPSTAPKMFNVICENFEKLLDFQSELKGDIYFCCLGTTIKKAKTKENFKKIDFDAVDSFARIASLHHALKFILISASGANLNSAIFYNKTKGQIEKKLSEYKLNSLVIFRPGLLLGEREEKRSAEKFSIDLVRILSPIIPDQLEKMYSTEGALLAERMIDESKNNTPPIKIIVANDI